MKKFWVSNVNKLFSTGLALAFLYLPVAGLAKTYINIDPHNITAAFENAISDQTGEYDWARKKIKDRFKDAIKNPRTRNEATAARNEALDVLRAKYDAEFAALITARDNYVTALQNYEAEMNKWWFRRSNEAGLKSLVDLNFKLFKKAIESLMQSTKELAGSKKKATKGQQIQTSDGKSCGNVISSILTGEYPGQKFAHISISSPNLQHLRLSKDRLDEPLYVLFLDGNGKKTGKKLPVKYIPFYEGYVYTAQGTIPKDAVTIVLFNPEDEGYYTVTGDTGTIVGHIKRWAGQISIEQPESFAVLSKEFGTALSKDSVTAHDLDFISTISEFAIDGNIPEKPDKYKDMVWVVTSSSYTRYWTLEEHWEHLKKRFGFDYDREITGYTSSEEWAEYNRPEEIKAAHDIYIKTKKKGEKKAYDIYLKAKADIEAKYTKEKSDEKKKQVTPGDRPTKKNIEIHNDGSTIITAALDTRVISISQSSLSISHQMISVDQRSDFSFRNFFTSGGADRDWLESALYASSRFFTTSRNYEYMHQICTIGNPRCVDGVLY